MEHTEGALLIGPFRAVTYGVVALFIRPTRLAFVVVSLGCAFLKNLLNAIVIQGTLSFLG